MSNRPQRTLEKAMDLMGQRRFAEARPLITTLARKAPKHPLVWNLLGVIAASDDDHEKAAEYFKKACALAPRDEDFQNNLGEAYRKSGRPKDALPCFEKALKIAPAHAAAHNNIGATLIDLDREEEAAVHLAKAIRLRPDNHEAYTNLGVALMNQRKPHEAIPCFEQAMSRNSDDPTQLRYHIHALEIVGRFDDALNLCEAMSGKDPRNIEAIVSRISVFERQGRRGDAWAALEPLLDSAPDHPRVARQYANLARTVDRRAEARDHVARVADISDINDDDRQTLYFALGSLEDGLENFDAAFAAYARGNAMARHHYDVAKNLAEVEAIEATHPPSWQARRTKASNRSRLPVFIIGMPRSGTTWCEQILACHPAVYGAGELMLIPKFEESVNPDEITSTVLDQFANDHLDFLHDQSGGAARVIDKLPHNHRFLGLIERLFPEARVIHCTRDPLDTCLSCYFQNFYGGHRYSFDMKTLGGHYRLYQRLMAHWRKVSGLNILDVSYESLVADQETISRSLVAFLGLEWDPACLDFHRSDRPALTASYEQVRQPIYSRSVRRAEKYAAHLEPLIAALEGRDGVAAA